MRSMLPKAPLGVWGGNACWLSMQVRWLRVRVEARNPGERWGAGRGRPRGVSEVYVIMASEHVSEISLINPNTDRQNVEDWITLQPPQEFLVKRTSDET